MADNIYHLKKIIEHHNVTSNNIDSKINKSIEFINSTGLLNEKGQILLNSNAIRNSIGFFSNLADYLDIQELSKKGEIDLPQE